MAKDLFIVAHPPVMQVEWNIPPPPKTWAGQDANSEPPPLCGRDSAAHPDMALLSSLPATGSPSQPGTGGSWASAVQAFFAHGGGGGAGKVYELSRIEGES